MTDVPYDELDPPIVALVRALNDLPGIRTGSSCGGHEAPLSKGSWPADGWYVNFGLESADADARVAVPSPEAWLSLEFLAWMVGDLQRANRAVALEPFAHPPFANQPSRMLSFQLSGRRGEGGIEPDEFADFLRRFVDDYYVPAEEVVWPEPDDEGDD